MIICLQLSENFHLAFFEGQIMHALTNGLLVMPSTADYKLTSCYSEIEKKTNTPLLSSFVDKQRKQAEIYQKINKLSFMPEKLKMFLTISPYIH